MKLQLKGRPPSLDEHIDNDSDENDDKLMMTEYDEDNVIVIDLSEERNGSTKNLLTEEDVDHLRPQRPRKMFGSSDEAESAEAVEASLNGTQPDVAGKQEGIIHLNFPPFSVPSIMQLQLCSTKLLLLPFTDGWGLLWSIKINIVSVQNSNFWEIVPHLVRSYSCGIAACISTTFTNILDFNNPKIF